MLKGAPSVQIQDVPPDTYFGSEDEDFEIDYDSRMNQREMDKEIHHENDFYDNEFDIDKDEEDKKIFEKTDHDDQIITERADHNQIINEKTEHDQMIIEKTENDNLNETIESNEKN
jgi:hypothetical protein